MQPRIPEPYRHPDYPFPASPLLLARRIRVADGAELATFVYGPQGAELTQLSEHAPVLALHGNGGSHSTFVQVVDRLCTAGLLVVAFDARAQGQSTRGSLPLTYELLAQDAVEVLDALGVDSAHVVGHSDGGIVGLLLARDHSSRVSSLVAGGANLTPEGVIDEWDTPGSVAANRRWAEWVGSQDVPAEVDRTLLPDADTTLLAGELLQLMLDEPHIDPASLEGIVCPTCVLVGEHDCIAREETCSIADAIPGARLVTVPGVGHSLPRMAPDSVTLQVLTNVLLAR